MQTRRDFIQAGSLAGASLLVGCRQPVPDGRAPAFAVPDEGADTTASDEVFWQSVRALFELDTRLINLNYGLSPSPRHVHEALESESRSVNRAPFDHMRDWPAEGRREEARTVAAEALGCDAEELAITRSATESLQIAQLGISLDAGDEVLSTSEEYWAMFNTWQQRALREGVVHRQVDLEAPYPPAEEIVARFEEALTPRTRIILFSHLTWVTGHILPVKDICALARSRGIQTIVDGAHSFGHIPFRVSDLGCDYYGTSGHKWLQAPLGTGLLYVRNERIRDLWPMTPAWDGYREDIRKFEFFGSRSPAYHNAVTDAVRFLRRIGVARKAARLHYLKRRWTEELARSDRVHIITDVTPGRSCGIASFYVQGMDSKSLVTHLREKYNIVVHAPENGSSGPQPVRVTPNVFTPAQEIDAFVAAMNEVLRSAPPANS